MEGAVNAAHEAVLTLSLEGPAGETRDIAAVVDTGFTGFLTVTPALAVELGLPFEGTARATLADGSETWFRWTGFEVPMRLGHKITVVLISYGRSAKRT